MKTNIKSLSCGFIIVHNNGKLLACHATGKPDKNGWDISKGHIEEGETPLECASRELKEETGLDSYRLEKVSDLGVWEYNASKDLHLFLAHCEFDVKKCKCTSYFEQYGRQIPEMDDFKLIDIDEIDETYYPNMANIIKKIFNK